MSSHSYIFSASLGRFSSNIEAEKSPLKSYKCSHCRVVIVVRADDRLDGDNILCEKWVNNLWFPPGTLYMPGNP